MKTITLGLALALGFPALAHAAEPVEEKGSCCKKMEGEKNCCDKDKQSTEGDHGDHAEHNGMTH